MAWEQEWSDNHADTDMPPVTALQLWTITDQAAVTCTQSNTPLGARADRFMTNALVGQYMTCAGWPESSLEFAESKTVKDQRQRLLSSDTLPEQTAAALWTGPRSAGTHCLEPQNNTAYYTGLLCIPKVRIWGFVWEHTKSSLDFQDNTVCTHLFTNS